MSIPKEATDKDYIPPITRIMLVDAEYKPPAKSDLEKAAKSNEIEELCRLIRLEMDKNSEDYENDVKKVTEAMKAACLIASHSNRPEALTMLLDSGCEIEDDIVEGAVIEGSKDVIDALIERGWDVNSPQQNPLSMAAMAGRINMVHFLLSRGADPNAVAPETELSILETSAMLSSINIVDALLHAGATLNSSMALAAAACNDRTDMIAHLLDCGANIDEVSAPLKGRGGEVAMTALCKAASCGMEAAVKQLLELGADPNVNTSDGKSALQLAKEGEREKALGPGHSWYEACIALLKEAS